MIHDLTSMCPCNSKGIGSSTIPIISAAGNIAAGTVPAILASGAAASAAAGGSGLILGLAPAVAVPVIGAAIAGITLAVTMFLNRNAQYFAEEKATTEIVNQAEVLMKQNLNAWRSSDKYYSEQKQALANFDNIWSQVVQACSNSEYQHGTNDTGLTPGQRCVSDRQRGGQWDWFSYYYDPIAGDPEVRSDPSAIDDVISNPGNIISEIVNNDYMKYLPLIIIGGLGVWALKEIG